MAPVCILLCAGKGSRMGDTKTHKVCQKIGGVPAVIRSIERLRAAGITRFIAVVGHRADQVMATLANEPGVTFAYQPEQLGTGNAVLYGLKAMADQGLTGPALIVMGDKLIASDVVENLIRTYEENKVGCVFATQPEEFNASGGRIVIRDGKVYGIVEMLDACLCEVVERGLDADGVRTYAEMMGLSSGKREKLMSAAAKGGKPTYTLAGEAFSASDIRASGVINTATYLMDSALAIRALARVGDNNTQGEVYLTDAVNEIAATAGACTVHVPEREKLLTYSTMEDLKKLEQYFHVEKPKAYRVSAWLSALEARFDKFLELYGEEKLAHERMETYREVLEAYQKEYGDEEVVIARAPGRVNLMGRHIEHRGGSINVISIDREVLAVAGKRNDDLVRLCNLQAQFETREFSISNCMKKCENETWLDFIESDEITKMVTEYKGDWVNYVMAGVLRLQMKEKTKPLCGMNLMISGNIPMAAGLSSSSAIVVATMEAAVALNDTNLKANEFIHLCGEGEWLVGSRGGAGDHAAMKSGKRGKITHISFCPFEIQQSLAFPEEYDMVVVNSFVDAKKSAGAKDQFNQRVASYEFGFMLLYENFPQFQKRMQFLKNINPQTLGVPTSKIYEMLLTLPERMTIDEIYDALPKRYHERIDRICKTHTAPEYYDIRGVILYGIAECERAEKCMELLEKRDFATLGKLMDISHNGDRVTKDGVAYDSSVSDVYLYRLIAELKSEDPDRVLNAQLWMQPGGYACSTPVIDDLVDSITRRDGVVGAQLSGAGLGGCIMALVEKAHSEDLLAYLKETYYDKNGLPMGAQVFHPVKGSGIFE